MGKQPIKLNTHDEVNREVAEKVMGWTTAIGFGCNSVNYYKKKPGYISQAMCSIKDFNPATDERDTFKVLNTSKSFEVRKYTTLNLKVYYLVKLFDGIRGKHEDFRIAACLAALEAATGNKHEYTGE